MTILKKLAIASVATLVTGAAFAADVSNDAGATIGSALAIKATDALEFGLIIPGDNTGNVTLSADGARRCDPALTCLGNDHQEANYTVTGEDAQSYTISLPQDTVELKSGNDRMKIGEFSGSKASGTLVSGQDTFSVGGVLTVGANQPAGRYTGSFTVSVNYQ